VVAEIPGMRSYRVVGQMNDGRRSVYQIDSEYCLNEARLADSVNPWAGEPVEMGETMDNLLA